MTDIDREFNDIIVEYDLDVHYPAFRSMLKAEEIIVEWMKEIGKTDRKILCMALHNDDIDYFSFWSRKYAHNINYLKFQENKIEEVIAGHYDEVWIISLEATHVAWCLDRENIPFYEIYDKLLEQGLAFEMECYRFCQTSWKGFWDRKESPVNNVQMEIFHLAVKEQRCVEVSRKILYIKMMYFLALYLRDFIFAGNCIEKLNSIGEKANISQCIQSWQKIGELLHEIKEKLKARNQEDILMIWMDAISYEEADKMPYLQKMRETGIDFINAFTVTPYTNETAKTIFLGTKVLDDLSYKIKDINRSNSALIRKLEDKNYKIEIVSGYIRSFDRSLVYDAYYTMTSACSQIFWTSLCTAFSSEQPLFIVQHALIETHVPNIYPGMTTEEFILDKIRISHGRNSLDRQMEYYMDYWGDKVVRIFMSDHGVTSNVNIRSHTNLIINGYLCQTKKIEGMFSYTEFTRLIEHILERKPLGEGLTTDYVKLQELDYYNKYIIGNFIRNKKEISYFYIGYRGIATKEHLYFRFNTGKERLIRRNSPLLFADYLNFNNEVEDDTKLEYFRHLAGDDAIDIYQDGKFAYTRYLYQVFDNYKRYSKRDKIINDIFSSFEDGSVALRMGGEHTAVLYQILRPENKMKIVACVDRDNRCIAGRLGLPIYPPDRINGLKVKYIVLSTNVWLAELKEEAKGYRKDLRIIDLYEMMAEEGVLYDRGVGIYRCEILPSQCYEVGFPFEDLDE